MYIATRRARLEALEAGFLVYNNRESIKFKKSNCVFPVTNDANVQMSQNELFLFYNSSSHKLLTKVLYINCLDLIRYYMQIWAKFFLLLL